MFVCKYFCLKLMTYNGYKMHGPLARYVKLWVTHAPGIPGTFAPLPPVSDPDMHHGTCVTYVPWCMVGSLTSGFQWREKRSWHSRRMHNPQFYVSGKRLVLCDAWREGLWLTLWTCLQYRPYLLTKQMHVWEGGFKSLILSQQCVYLEVFTISVHPIVHWWSYFIFAGLLTHQCRPLHGTIFAIEPGGLRLSSPRQPPHHVKRLVTGPLGVLVGHPNLPLCVLPTMRTDRLQCGVLRWELCSHWSPELHSGGQLWTRHPAQIETTARHPGIYGVGCATLRGGPLL